MQGFDKAQAAFDAMEEPGVTYEQEFDAAMDDIARCLQLARDAVRRGDIDKMEDYVQSAIADLERLLP